MNRAPTDRHRASTAAVPFPQPPAVRRPRLPRRGCWPPAAPHRRPRHAGRCGSPAPRSISRRCRSRRPASGSPRWDSRRSTSGRPTPAAPTWTTCSTGSAPRASRSCWPRTSSKLYAFSVYRGGYRKYAELLGKAGGGVAVRGSAGPCDPKELDRADEGLSRRPQARARTGREARFLPGDREPRPRPARLARFVQGVRRPQPASPAGHRHGPVPLAGLEGVGRGGDRASPASSCSSSTPGSGPRRHEQLPGIGPTDCAPWIAALAKVDYRWYVNPFMHHEPEPDEMAEALAKSRDYLKECYASAAT